MSSSKLYNRFQEMPRNHFAITKSDTADLPYKGCMVYAGSNGTIACHDMNGVAVTYTLTAGQMVPVLVQRVLSTGTSVTSIIGVY